MPNPAPPETVRRPVVLYVGIEWDQLPDSFPAETKLRVKHGVEAAMAELRGQGYDARWCGISTDPASAVAVLAPALRASPVDSVLIGAGLRKSDPMVALFERVVREVHAACPAAAICFNTQPEDSLAAVRRGLAR